MFAWSALPTEKYNHKLTQIHKTAGGRLVMSLKHSTSLCSSEKLSNSSARLAKQNVPQMVNKEHRRVQESLNRQVSKYCSTRKTPDIGKANSKVFPELGDAPRRRPLTSREGRFPRKPWFGDVIDSVGPVRSTVIKQNSAQRHSTTHVWTAAHPTQEIIIGRFILLRDSNHTLLLCLCCPRGLLIHVALLQS